MNLMKVALLVLVLGVVAMLYFVMPGDREVSGVRKVIQSNTPASRADDPTYAEEVSALSARFRAGAEASKKEKIRVKSQLKTMEQTMADMKRQAALAANRTTVDPGTQDQLSSSVDQRILNALDPIKQQISALANAAQSRGRTSGGNVNTGNYSALQGHVKIRPFGGANSAGIPVIEPDAATKKKSKLIPVYTLHSASMLTDSVAVTPIIGRVPNGGSVTDPFRFRITTGGTNLMANGHQVPGVKSAIWSGYAIGVREESCVRGYLDTVTFVFEDGRIVTQTSGKRNRISSSKPVSESLGYLADPYGKQCLAGTLINNASKYLKGRAGAAFLEGMAAAYAQAQTTVRDYGTGGVGSYVDGDVYAYGLGLGISKSAAELADYVRERQANAFDVVYFPSNQKVQIMIEEQIEIDYDPDGRKVAYFNETGGSNASSITLD